MDQKNKKQRERKVQAHLRRFRGERKVCVPLPLRLGESIDPLKEAYAALADSGTESNGSFSTKHAVLSLVRSSSL